MTKSDTQQVQELMFHYGNACDDKDYAFFRKCFTADAVVHYSKFSHELHGPEQVIDYLRLCLTPLDGTHHIFTNFIVDVDGDSARFTCGLHAQHMNPRAPGGELYTVGGKYAVDLVRTAEGWKMQRLEFKPLWSSGNPALLAHAVPEDA